MSRSNSPPTSQDAIETVETLTPDNEPNVYTVESDGQTFVVHEQETRATIYHRTSTSSDLTDDRLFDLVEVKEVHDPRVRRKDMPCDDQLCTQLHSFLDFCESELETHILCGTVVKVDIQRDYYGTSIDASLNPLEDAEGVGLRLMEQIDTGTPLIMETYNSDGQRFLEVSALLQSPSALLPTRRRRRRRRGPGSGGTSR